MAIQSRFRLAFPIIDDAPPIIDNRWRALLLPLWAPEFLLGGVLNMIDIILGTVGDEMTLLVALVAPQLVLWNVSITTTTATAAITAATAAAVYATAAPAGGSATAAARGATITIGILILDLGM